MVITLKWLAVILAAVFFTAPPIFAQASFFPADEYKFRITAETDPKEIKSIIRSYEKRLESIKGENSSASKAKAYIEFGLFRKHVSGVLIARLAGSRPLIIARGGVTESIAQFHDNAQKTLECFKSAIREIERGTPSESADLIRAKFELAKFIEVYDPRAFSVSDLRDRLKRATEAQGYYEQAIVLHERLYPKSIADRASMRFWLSSSLMETADFEKALPQLRRYIEEVTIVEGETSEALKPALELSAAIALMADDGETAAELAKRMDAITKQKTDLSGAYLDLTLRAHSTNKGLNEPEFYMRIDPPPVRYAPSLEQSPIRRPTLNRTESLTPAGRFSLAAIPVVVIIDNNGSVIDAAAHESNDKLKTEAERAVSGWKFRPLKYNGSASRMKGIVYYWKER